VLGELGANLNMDISLCSRSHISGRAGDPERQDEIKGLRCLPLSTRAIGHQGVKLSKDNLNFSRLIAAGELRLATDSSSPDIPYNRSPQ
jgi:hypothetical protein